VTSEAQPQAGILDQRAWEELVLGNLMEGGDSSIYWDSILDYSTINSISPLGSGIETRGRASEAMAVRYAGQTPDGSIRDALLLVGTNHAQRNPELELEAEQENYSVTMTDTPSPTMVFLGEGAEAPYAIKQATTCYSTSPSEGTLISTSTAASNDTGVVQLDRASGFNCKSPGCKAKSFRTLADLRSVPVHFHCWALPTKSLNSQLLGNIKVATIRNLCAIDAMESLGLRKILFDTKKRYTTAMRHGFALIPAVTAEIALSVERIISTSISGTCTDDMLQAGIALKACPPRLQARPP
jgi:hypothetical protein